MVRPDHIEEAERVGMPEHEPETIECDWCLNRHYEDDIVKCDTCGKYLCEDCRIDVGEIIDSYSGNIVCDDPDHSCVIRFLVSVIEQNDAYILKLQVESNKDDEIAKAARKASTTGNLKDLQEYLRLRRQL